eukprot:8702105-Alexandrium_andersonii.AAC.1
MLLRHGPTSNDKAQQPDASILDDPILLAAGSPVATTLRDWRLRRMPEAQVRRATLPPTPGAEI